MQFDNNFMKQFSTDTSPITLKLLSGHLLFIDPLYFQDIIEGQDQVDTSALADRKEFVRQLEERLFPYSGGVLLGYKHVDIGTGNYLFDPLTLRKWNYDDIELRLLAQQKQITAFGLDTASFLIIDLDNFEKLIQLITYDTLIDALLSNQLDKYFEQINSELGNNGWAYLSSEGVETSSEFDGDGSYIVD